MRHNNLMRYLVVAAAALVVGLLVAGTSWQTILPLLVLLGCPVMMIFMMGGHGGHGSAPGQHHHDGDQRDDADAGRRL